MSKGLQATLLHLVYSKKQKKAILFTNLLLHLVFIYLLMRISLHHSYLKNTVRMLLVLNAFKKNARQLPVLINNCKALLL